MNTNIYSFMIENIAQGVSMFLLHSACPLYLKQCRCQLLGGQNKKWVSKLTFSPLVCCGWMDGWEERKLGHTENFRAWYTMHMLSKQSRTKTETISVPEIYILKENAKTMYLLIYWTLGTYRTNEKDRKCHHLVDITEMHESGLLWDDGMKLQLTWDKLGAKAE